jgi:hypothetical protein
VGILWRSRIERGHLAFTGKLRIYQMLFVFLQDAASHSFPQTQSWDVGVRVPNSPPGDSYAVSIKKS